MTTLVYLPADDGPGPILADHTRGTDYVVTGVYGYVRERVLACPCGEDAAHFMEHSHVTFTWTQAEPCAVTMDLVHRSGERFEWVYGRDLLARGGGLGQVSVEVKQRTVEVKLAGEKSAIKLAFDRKWLNALLTSTEEIVPFGEELSGTDWGPLLEDPR